MTTQTCENKRNQIIIYPELVAEVLKKNESDIFILWLVIRSLNTQGTGLVLISDILILCDKILGIKSTHAYAKIHKGVNKYWRAPYGTKGNKYLGLFSFKQIVKSLNPELTRSEPIVVPLSYFYSHGNKNSKHIKNFFIGCVAGRYTDNRPISIASLIENCGAKESSIRNAIKDCAFINQKPNFRLVMMDKDILKVTIQKNVSANCLKLRVIKNEDYYQLVEQLPNSYIITEFDRLPLRLRPDALKKNENVASLKQRRYHRSKKSTVWSTVDKPELTEYRVKS
jgi:hypothetical protein